MNKKSFITCMLLAAVFAGCGADQSKPSKPAMSVQDVSTDKYLNVNGLNIRYKDEGRRTGRTLVLLHGFTSSLETWDGLVEALGKDYRIIRFDLPGHGLTGPDPNSRYSHEDFVRIVHGLISQLKLDKPVLVGNSMGGNTAWRYAATYPQDLSGLILIDASGFSLNGLGDEPIPLQPALKNYFLNPTEFAVNYGLKTQYADAGKISKTRAENILAMMRGNGDAYVKIYKGFTLPDPTSKLGKIITPTLIIWGEKDSVIPPSHAQLFQKAIPNSEVRMIENSGHVSQEEHPAQTAQIISDFLNKE